MKKLLILTFASSLLFANGAKKDDRVEVKLPEPIKVEMLTNMRDHLQSLSSILDALAKKEYDRAGEIAENRLGMSALNSHNAHTVAKYRPQKMNQLGMKLHKSASKFALTVQEEDDTKIYKALNAVVASCTACHSLYKVAPNKR